jgi:hypothetical protein
MCKDRNLAKQMAEIKNAATENEFIIGPWLKREISCHHPQPPVLPIVFSSDVQIHIRMKPVKKKVDRILLAKLPVYNTATSD